MPMVAAQSKICPSVTVSMLLIVTEFAGSDGAPPVSSPPFDSSKGNVPVGAPLTLKPKLDVIVGKVVLSAFNVVQLGLPATKIGST